MSHLQTPVCTLEHSLVLGQVSKAASAILGHRAGERREHWLSVSHLCVQPLAGWVAGAPTPAADLGCLRAAREPLRSGFMKLLGRSPEVQHGN